MLHMSFWRAAYIISFVFTKWRRMVLTIIALGILFWTATKAAISRNKLRASNTSPNVVRSARPGYIPKPINRPSFSENKANTNKWASRESSLDKKFKEGQNQVQAQVSTPIRGRSPLRPKPSSDIGKKSLQANITENNEADNTNSTLSNKPSNRRRSSRTSCIMHSSIRSFQPQLEDIKSSLLLLDKKEPEPKLNTCDNSVAEESKTSLSVPPTKSFEEMRRQQLREAKRKFYSKKFWADSKYDKIEGLNWISWK